jgi:hypothetical protein
VWARRHGGVCARARAEVIASRIVKGGPTFPFLFFGVRPGDWFDDAAHAYELHFVQSLDEDRRLAVARAARVALTGAAWAGPWRWQGRFALVCLRPLAASPESVRALHAAAVVVARAVHAVAPLVSVTYLHAADAGTDPWDDDTLCRALAPVAGPRWSTVSAGLVAEPGRPTDESEVDPAVESLLHGAVWAVERTERPAPAAEPVATSAPAVSSALRAEEPAPRAEAVPLAAGYDAETPPPAAPSSEAAVEGPAELVSVSQQTEDAPVDWAAVARLSLAPTTWPAFTLQAQYPKAQEVTAPRAGRELAVVEDRKGAHFVLWVEGTTWKHGPLDQASDTSHPSLHPTRDAVLFVDDLAETVMLWEPPAAPRALPIPSKGESFSDCAWLDASHFVLIGQDHGPTVFALHGDTVTLCGRAVLSGYMMAAVPGGFFVWDMEDVGKVTAALLAWDGAALRIVGAVESLSILRVASDGARLFLDAGRGKRGGVFAVDDLAGRVQEALRGDPVRHPVRPLLAARLAAAAPRSEEEDNQVDEESDGDDDEAEPQPDSVEDADEAFSIGQDKRSDGETDAAIVWMERAVALRPTYAEAWGELGLARREGGDAAGAHEAWTEALRLHELAAQEPDAHEARFDVATLLARLGRRDEMLTALAAVAKALPHLASWARDEEAYAAYHDDAEFVALTTPPPKKKKAKKG